MDEIDGLLKEIRAVREERPGSWGSAAATVLSTKDVSPGAHTELGIMGLAFLGFSDELREEETSY